jgi:hypothetical protein
MDRIDSMSAGAISCIECCEGRGDVIESCAKERDGPSNERSEKRRILFIRQNRRPIPIFRHLGFSLESPVDWHGRNKIDVGYRSIAMATELPPPRQSAATPFFAS